jgi:hypothetical protein
MNLLLIWSIGIYFIWLKARRVLQEYGNEIIAGKYKAVLELATAIQENLKLCRREDLNPEMTEAELEKLIEDLKGGYMAYTIPALRREPIKFRKLLWAWFVWEKWWVAACVAFLLCSSTGWMIWDYRVVMLWIWSFGPGIGLFIAISICTTLRSRILFTFVCSIVTAIPAVTLGVYTSHYTY